MPNLDRTKLLPVEILDGILDLLTPSDVLRVAVLARHLRSVALKHELYYHELDWHIDPNLLSEVSSHTIRLIAASILGLPLSIRLSIDDVDDDEVSSSAGTLFVEALAECMPQITAMIIETEDERVFQRIIGVIAQRPATRLRTFRSHYTGSSRAYRFYSLRRPDVIWPTTVFAGDAPLLKVFDLQGFNGPSGLQSALRTVQDVYVRCSPRFSSISALATTFPGSKNWSFAFENPIHSPRERDWDLLNNEDGLVHIDMPRGLASISITEEGLRTDNVLIAAIMQNVNCATYRSIRIPISRHSLFDLTPYTSKSGFPALGEGLLFIVDVWNIHAELRSSMLLISLISMCEDRSRQRSRIFQTTDSPLHGQDSVLNLFRGVTQHLVEVVIPHEYLPIFLGFAAEMPLIQVLRVTMKYFRQFDVDEPFWPLSSRDGPVPSPETPRLPRLSKLEVTFDPAEIQAERLDQDNNPLPAQSWTLQASQIAVLARELGLHHLPAANPPTLELVELQLEHDESLEMFSAIKVGDLIW